MVCETVCNSSVVGTLEPRALISPTSSCGLHTILGCRNSKAAQEP
jgi:hypothetical protein